MLIKINIDGTSNKGHPLISTVCLHCGMEDMTSLFLNFYRQWKFFSSKTFEEGLPEFQRQINSPTERLDMYPRSKRMQKNLMEELCFCEEGVVDLEHIRGVRRAKDILARGLALLEQQQTGELK